MAARRPLVLGGGLASRLVLGPLLPVVVDAGDVVAPPGFALLAGADGALLTGADGAYLYGVA